MNSERLNEILEKIPFGVLLFVFLIYLGYDFYSFSNSPDSPLIEVKTRIDSAKEQKTKLELKLKQSNEFVKTLELKKAELRRLALELQDLKTTLSERLDVPSFMKMVITEAKKVGITVVSLNPNGSVNKEYYSEGTFILNFRGIFIQLLAFLDRLSNVTEIVRVENFSIKPRGTNRVKFVELEGVVELKTYRYLGTKADSVGTGDANSQKTDPGAPKSPATQGSPPAGGST